MTLDRESIYGAVRMGYSQKEIALLQDGEPLTRDQRKWFAEARLLLKHEKQQEAERKARENLDGWMQGTTWDGARGQKPAPPARRPGAAPFDDTRYKRERRAAARELGELPPPANPWRRNMIARYSLLAFGLEYCMGTYEGMDPLLARPPSQRMTSFIQALQNAIWFGGLKHVRWPRGKGKTTWVKIAAMWAILYGYKKFFVVVAKVKTMGREMVDEVWQRIRLSPEISADFPEFAVPMDDVATTPQRMRVQTYRGKQTRMRQDTYMGYYRFPTMDGQPHTGGIICYRGADQALRGINIESRRPDFFFIDDPQTNADATNPETVGKIEDNINSAVLAAGKTDRRISAVMASTPIEPDDVSERFADPQRHPEWMADTERFVVKWGDADLREQYLALLAADQAKGDASLASSRAFYQANRAAIERGVEMMDSADFDPASEISAYQHALWLLHNMKHKRFHSEMQMQPRRDESVINITPGLILSRIRKGARAAAIPDGTVMVCVATDINPSYALTCVAIAYDQLCTGTVIDHWRHPCNISVTLNDTEFHQQIYNKLAEVQASFATRGLNPASGDFHWGIDCSGAQFKSVNRFVFEQRRTKAVDVWALRGLDNKWFNPRISTRKFPGVPGRNDTVLTLDKATGWEHVNFNKDKHELAAQRAWLSAVGAPGGLSLYEPRDGHETHEEFALQVCGEQLKWKPADPDRDRIGFKWDDKAYPRHDYGDCSYMCRALAAFLGLAADGAPFVVRTSRKRRAIIGGQAV